MQFLRPRSPNPWPRSARSCTVLAVAFTALMGCGGSEPGASDAGTSPDATADAGVVDSGPVDTGPTDTGPADTGVEPDAGPADTGVEPDAGPTDTGVEPDAGTSFPTLADYRLCEIDTDCPVGLGRCVKDLALNRAEPGGQSSVVLSDIDSRIPSGQGVCSESCTRDLSACETLTLKDSAGQDVPFSCQVVAVGASPYPATQPAYPFADQIDAAEMILGQPFAALCRPPFELDAAHSPDFCGACDSTGGCTGGTCWNFGADAPVQTGEDGVCLETNLGTCPVGFAALSLQDGATDLGEHCVPLQETCGNCQDRDGDTWGVGHCANVQLDCDDRNASAYYDNLTPEHAFPTFCGVHDYNCNGLSDDTEQVGVEAYKASHCEACGDDADGRTVNAGTSSEALLECVGGQIQVAACTDAAQVHCSGDPRQTGCEATASAGGQTFYRDSDQDTYGDINTPTLGCPGGGAPSGYVVDSTDCNDGNIDIHPNVPDLCDCWGDCAQAGAQVDNDCDNSVDEDVSAYSWGTDGDSDGASGAAFDNNTYCGAPAANLVLGDGTEDCNDGSGASYGVHSRITDAAGTILSLPLTNSPARDSNGNLYVVSVSAPTEVCDGEDNNCLNGVDDGVQTTYYFDGDTDTFGDPAVTADACSAPTNYVSDSTDCDDSEITIYPGATELCDGIDRDCMSDGDALVALGGSCTTALLGNCSAGTQTACVNAAFVCTQVNQPTLFDNPHVLPDDEDCDGAETIIYVDPAGNEANPGTAGSPKGTLMQAIAGASALGATQVHMLAGAHSVSEPQVLVSNLDIVGGLSRSGNVWTAGGGQSLLLHDGTAVDGDAIVLSVGNINTTIAYLDLQVAAGAETGVNHFGIYARSANNLRIQTMNITIEAGTDGAGGADGSVGQAGRSSMPPSVSGFACGMRVVTGGNGATGTVSPNASDGSGENPGAGGTAGGIPSVPNGGDGGDSANAAGAGTVFSPTVLGGTWDSSGATDPEDGLHGSGGGGGAALGQAWGGPGGSGGCGGTAGENGQSGGSAIGIFSYLSEGLTMDAVTISVVGGGDGGDGGDGGNGGAGGAGSMGQLFGPSGIGYEGGDGSSGAGGAGGGAGYGGHAYPIFHQGVTDLCSSALLTNVVRNTTALPGFQGSRGSRGTGASNLNGNRGTAAEDGFQVDCLWSEPCTGGTCSNGNFCLFGYCQP